MLRVNLGYARSYRQFLDFAWLFGGRIEILRQVSRVLLFCIWKMFGQFGLKFE